MKHPIITCILLTAGTTGLLAFPGHGEGQRRHGPPPPDQMAERVIADFDTNASLGVDEIELADALAFLHENRPPPPPEVRERQGPPEPEAPDHGRLAARLLTGFDHDQDGQLNIDELTEAFAELQERRGPPRPLHTRD